MQLYSGVPGVDDLAAELAAAADVPAGPRPHRGYRVDQCERESHGPQLRGGNRMEGPVAGSDKHTGHRKRPSCRLFVYTIEFVDLSPARLPRSRFWRDT